MTRLHFAYFRSQGFTVRRVRIILRHLELYQPVLLALRFNGRYRILPAIHPDLWELVC